LERDKTMKRAIVVSIMLLAGVVGAHADYYETTYRDLIRPHGKPRSDAVYQANLDVCFGQTHENRTLPDTPAFKKCMLVHGYRFFAMRDVKTTPDGAHAPSVPDYAGPSIDISIGGDAIDDDGAAQRASQAADEASRDAQAANAQATTQMINDANAQTVQGIMGQ
jgi:hypothetical protein